MKPLSHEKFVEKHAVKCHNDYMGGGYGVGYDYATASIIYGEDVIKDMKTLEKWCREDYYSMGYKDWAIKWISD